ncbi:hypothetical protein [Sphingomonas endophytica]|uniref:hypothetical protein n=1 Tax=Sphingomonas endophytica TaxID=869719 RepID=UPI000ABD32C1|nr:hypothetical protein [Sphingomonas endophytica]
MDLNYLFHRHQVSLMMAAAAIGSEARCAHGQLARRYAARIVREQVEGGVSAPFVAA